jgi:glycosyltransferase involved in cell wall biosynthesis
MTQTDRSANFSGGPGESFVDTPGAGVGWPCDAAMAPAVAAATPKPAKILHLCSDYAVIGDLYALYARALAPPRFESALMFLCGPESARLASRCDVSACFLDLPARSLSGLRLGALRRLHERLRGAGYDAVIAHRYRAFHLAVWLCALGVVPRVYGVVHAMGQFRTTRHRVIARLASRLPVTLVAVSHAVREDLARDLPFFPRQRLVAVPNATRTDLANRQLSRSAARAVLGLPDDAYVFGAMGRLTPRKGYGYLLDAFAAAAPQCPGARLVLMGEGRAAADLRCQAAALGLSGRVSFAGWRDEAPLLVPAFDTFVQPSVQEGFGLALAEAMAACVPVIASHTGGIPEVAGEHAWLVRPGDVDGLRTALIAYYQMPAPERRALGAALHARWRAQFSEAPFRARLEQVLGDVRADRRA